MTRTTFRDVFYVQISLLASYLIPSTLNTFLQNINQFPLVYKTSYQYRLLIHHVSTCKKKKSDIVIVVFLNIPEI
jgi:hypothetical protein